MVGKKPIYSYHPFNTPLGSGLFQHTISVDRELVIAIQLFSGTRHTVHVCDIFVVLRPQLVTIPPPPFLTFWASKLVKSDGGKNSSEKYFPHDFMTQVDTRQIFFFSRKNPKFFFRPNTLKKDTGCGFFWLFREIFGWLKPKNHFHERRRIHP